MATVTLGNIKLNWKGAYNAGTAYAIDDVVSYNGSSYVAKTATTGNLPTVTANWDIMSQAGTNGTNGTDLTTTLTTQGDIVYRDGSGLARLGYGTSGNVLTTKGSGQNPVWEPAVGGKIGQVVNTIVTANTSTGSNSWVDISGMSATITPSATSSKVLWSFHTNVGSDSQYGKIKIVYGNGSDLTTTAIGDARGSRHRTTIGGIYDSGNDRGMHNSMQGLDSPNTTSATTYKLQWRIQTPTFYLNRRAHDQDATENDCPISSITLMEVLA